MDNVTASRKKLLFYQKFRVGGSSSWFSQWPRGNTGEGSLFLVCPYSEGLALLGTQKLSLPKSWAHLTVPALWNCFFAFEHLCCILLGISASLLLTLHSVAISTHHVRESCGECQAHLIWSWPLSLSCFNCFSVTSNCCFFIYLYFIQLGGLVWYKPLSESECFSYIFHYFMIFSEHEKMVLFIFNKS